MGKSCILYISLKKYRFFRILNEISYVFRLIFTAMASLKIDIADNNFVYANGLSLILQEWSKSNYFKNSPDIRIGDIFLPNESLVQNIKASETDILICHFDYTDDYYLHILKYLNNTNVKILINAIQRGRRLLYKLRNLKVHGCIYKDGDETELFNALDKIITNETYFSERIKSCNQPEKCKIDSKSSSKLPEKILSKREYEILKLTCEELSTSEIANYLSISTKTVETHKGRIMQKTGTKNNVGLVKYAYRFNVL